MTWDSHFWDQGHWDTMPQPPIPLPNPKKRKKRPTMKKQNYYPSRLSDQAAWLSNYATKLPNHATTFDLDPLVVTAIVNDAKWGKYVLGDWLPAVRAFSPSTSDSIDAVLSGEGASALVLPTFTAPALPTGVTPALPGVATRIFDQAAILKRSPFYTDVIGTDLGIIGAETTAQPTAPKLTVKAEQGGVIQCVKLVFSKYLHMGVHIESRRGTGDWEFLAIDTESPYLDERPLMVANTPEVREYRARFWDKGTPNGDWTDVAKVTVSP